MDLDVEEFEEIDDIIKLINQLKADFGPDFIITLAPVASALTEDGNLSGFDYIELESRVGSNISWYNAQFYSGFGSFFPDDQYIEIVEFGKGLDPEKLVATSLTSPDDGFGFIDPQEVVSSALNLSARYGFRFGGVAGWEYFNSEPDRDEPWQWATLMHNAMNQIQAMAKAAGSSNNRRSRIWERD
jgi:hypothetical protein